ncbi:hypothetical protein P153DRAFT_356419 [Dothidotthia symphoricarpi CBS 119687]|uniref:Uncharacterized protein n=1 Tax=Dothidotthia symphoricarpi CBS 119687 TaxID=1392245 RepID=A0A6A6ACU4_9PLEO|nr:uncharacterized protein P153DRAFT_356419 [Dothidotthia symphoricarpi CBS 119687]KAF2129722.1 hypothetical protein P153DRAFT_356419 [Dothidotthia symphoricarpi CBS 119687]
MAITGIRVALLTLSALAVVLLQGLFNLNGGLEAMKKHAKEGVFSNGKTLHHVYLGYPVIDDILSWSVSFWDPVCHESRSTLLLSKTLSASLQSLGVFAMIESLRRQDKNIILRWSPVNVFVWQYLGAAIFVPLYFVVELESHLPQRKAADPTVPYLQAKSLLPASTVTILHLYRMVYFPPAGITTSQHQAWLAVWQLAPVFCYCALAALSTSLSRGDEKLNLQSQNADARWIKATYSVFGAFSGVTHVAVMWLLASSKDTSVSLSAAFIPKIGSLWKSDTANSVFINEYTFFLQWDYIIIVIAGGIYATRIVDMIYYLRGCSLGLLSKVVVFIVAGTASHLFGCGLVWAAVLYAREDLLRLEYAKSLTKETEE